MAGSSRNGRPSICTPVQKLSFEDCTLDEFFQSNGVSEQPPLHPLTPDDLATQPRRRTLQGQIE